MKRSGELSLLSETALNDSIHLGFSVIPLTGKRPPERFNLSKYQTQRPTAQELRAWFSDHTLSSYGVICGAVSGGLLVLDFDSVAAYDTFAALFPALAASYTVKTRRGCHVYLRSSQRLRSRKIPGGDLLAQGSLVVGAGSSVNDFRYSIAISAPILTLSDNSLKSLLLWACHKEDAAQPHTPITIGSDSPISRLTHLYSTQAATLGRNNALYRAAISAAQSGINQADTMGSLALLYAATPAVWAHPTESTPQRLKEAAATIASAYKSSHNPRHTRTETIIGLPNALREFLLKAQQSCITARLLDIFALAGWLAGRIFCTREAVEIAAQYGLGRASVLAILSGRLSHISNQRVIPTTETTHSHSHNTQPPPDGERDNERFNSRGRKTNYYAVPDLASLCGICGISNDQMGSIDPLTAQDVASEKAYRMALHRELVKRAAPELSYRWHAARLSVSARTVRRYNAALGVIVTPIFGYAPLSWANVEREELWGVAHRSTDGRIITPGRWLQNTEGKRYPALKGIACRLLKNHFQLIACKRLPSRFQLPIADRPIVLHRCIWRRLDAAAPDWGGGEYEYPMGQGIVAAAMIDATDALNAPPDETLIHFVNSYMSLPQDLTVLKGVGTWYATILNAAGLTRYEHLAQADAERIARLSGIGQYVTPHQAAFWIDQARALVAKAVSAADLQGWVYKDWRVYDFERRRIDSASHTLRQALAREFHEKGWLKYRGQLPEWFVAMVNTQGGV